MTAAEDPVASPSRRDEAGDTVRDGGASADRAHLTPEAEPTRYVRLRRPHRRLSTGGIVVAGAAGEAYLLEPGAELLWEILEAPRTIDEVVSELERLERQAEELTITESFRTGISPGTTGEARSSDRRAQRRPMRAAAMGSIEDLRRVGIVDVA